MRLILSISCIIGILAFVSSATGTTVVWYGANCTDERALPIENGDLVQLIRSPDATIGAPDPVTGEPSGNDSVVATATYMSSENAFQGEDWREADGSCVCVRIWNARDAETGTYYWDSPVYQAAGMLPVDIDCAGAKTLTKK
jgi:hypothetical protein